MEKKTTQKGKSYWNGDAAYNEEYKELWDKLVPRSGDAPTVHGELIRCFSRLSYDYYNNGNCNAVDTSEINDWRDCGECDGEGYDYYGDDCQSCGGNGSEMCDEALEYSINDYYLRMLNFIRKECRGTDVEDRADEVEEFMLRPDLGYSNYEFTDKEERVYVMLGDAIMHYVLTTENEENPEFKEEPV